VTEGGVAMYFVEANPTSVYGLVKTPQASRWADR
jgi:hypothetical protein